jgi:hypothetical protein
MVEVTAEDTEVRGEGQPLKSTLVMTRTGGDYDQHDRGRREVYETPEQKIRNVIIKLGDIVSIKDTRYFSF